MECSRLNGTGCSERGVAFLSIIFDSARSLSEDLFSSSCLTIFQIYIYIYDLFYFALMHFAHIMKITSILATLRTSTIVTTRGACPRQREKKGNLSSLSLIDRQQSYTRTNIVFLCCAIPPRPHTFPPPPFPPKPSTHSIQVPCSSRATRMAPEEREINSKGKHHKRKKKIKTIKARQQENK